MKKTCFLLMTFILLICISFSIAADNTTPTFESVCFESGVYTIKNKANSEYLNTFDLQYSSDGYAYTDKKSGEEGENILFLAVGDGTYLIYPQSESGKYAFYSKGVGERIAKSEETEAASHFSIKGDEDGYVILDNIGNAIGVTEGETLYRKTLVKVEAFSGADTQKWEITPVELTSFELKTVAEEVKLYSTSAVYAVTKPAYMSNFVKWSSSDDSMLMMDDDGSFCALKEGTMTVTATVGEVSRSIDIKIVDKDAYTWYSQHLATAGGWHGGELSGVYFYSGSHKRFIINGFNRGLDWMDEGCALTSCAMVLNNLGARYDGGYDFRFDQDGYLEADPYTVSLANSGNRGLTSPNGTLYNNPISINIKKIASSFTLYGEPLEAERMYYVTKQKLKEALDEHPEGVIVGMENTRNGSHYIVVTECVNPEASNPNNYKFKIYDSAGLRREQGDDVAFEDSISYKTMGYRYSHMRSMIVFNLASEK